MTRRTLITRNVPTLSVLLLIGIVFGITLFGFIPVIRKVQSRIVPIQKIQAAIGGTITVDAPLVVSGTNVFSASKFADNANSSFYLAPAGATSLVVNGDVGIGTTAPALSLHIVNEFATGGNTIYADTFGSTSITDVPFVGRAARGTKSSPSAPQTNDVLGGLEAKPYDGSAFTSGSKATLSFYAAENFSTTNQGTYISIKNTAIGTTTPVERIRITDAGKVGIGTTAPIATLEVAGRIAGSGTGTPTLSNCGTSPTITGTDTRGHIHMGSGSPTSCTVTFAAAYSVAPYCMISTATTSSRSYVSSVSTTGFVINVYGVYDYICIQ
jgi:hypothetical protein